MRNIGFPDTLLIRINMRIKICICITNVFFKDKCMINHGINLQFNFSLLLFNFQN
jgi:hypothetical protein